MPRYKYTHGPLKVFHRINVDVNAELVVEGDGGNASYEWRLEGRNGRVLAEHSDCGYGDPAVALRDGLIAYFGAPTDGPGYDD